MIDDSTSKDETEPVCAPLMRLEASVRYDNGAADSNGVSNTDLDQTEPCAFAPMLRVQAKDGSQTDEDNGKA